MIDFYRNSRSQNYDINISVDEWMDILCLPKIQDDENILLALEKWYLAPDYTDSCKSLGERYEYDYHFFSVQNKRLDIIAVNHLKRFRLIGDGGKETYWGVAWIELKREKGIYTVRLRPELVDAIRSLGLFTKDTDDTVNEYLRFVDVSHV